MPAMTNPTLRKLSESEIQGQLYGEYHTESRPRNGRAATTTVDEPSWTGQEILARELQRLAKEMAELRQEKERLALEITRRVTLPPVDRTVARQLPLAAATVEPRPATAPVASASVITVFQPAVVSEASSSPVGTLASVLALLLTSAVLAVAFHAVVLEARPPVMADAAGSLYSVQAAVYDVKPMAQQFMETLSRQGYPAFLVEETTRRGRSRYRVYVGRHASKGEAEAQLTQLKQNPLLRDSFILQRR